MNQIIRKIAVYATVGALGLSLASPILAKGPKGTFDDPPDTAGSRPGLLRNFLTNGRAAIGSCTLTAINGTALGGSFTCTKDGKTYTIHTTAQTQLRRRFWGKASWSEFSINDVINVIGKWANDAKTIIDARLVRDTSIQKRFGVFIGVVQSVNGTGWVMTTHRGTETVTVTGTTKFVNRKNQPITKADIAVGHKVRVRGLWDSKNSTITEVTQVKDFSLPPQPTGKPTPTP